MRIWFDLSNSPHINLFADLIADLEQDHEVLITCRPLANTIELLELRGLKYQVVGKHYGAGLAMKVIGFPVRIGQLIAYLRRKKVNVAVSQSSFHSPVVARLLGIPSIYMNDNEHALGNVPAFICATRVLVPEYLSMDKVRRQGAARRKVVHYPGVKEGIYLWNGSPAARSGNATESVRDVPNIYVRPEPSTAQYYKGNLNFLDETLVQLAEQAEVTVLPRGKDQVAHFRQPRFSKIRVLDKPLSLEDIASDCDVFVGAGGTMTREMAVLGVPTISVYQDELLEVDRFLISEGLMVHRPDADWRFVMQFVADLCRREPNTDLLRKGREAFDLLRDLIQDLGSAKVGN